MFNDGLGRPLLSGYTDEIILAVFTMKVAEVESGSGKVLKETFVKTAVKAEFSSTGELTSLGRRLACMLSSNEWERKNNRSYDVVSLCQGEEIQLVRFYNFGGF